MTAAPALHLGVSTKAYFGWHRSLEWLDDIARVLEEHDAHGVEVFVIPSDPVLPAAVERLAPLGALIGAQDIAWGEGALTGETSPRLLAELGVRMAEIGHAERRALFAETDEVVARKAAAALDAGLQPLLCVGETERVPAAQAVRLVVEQTLDALRNREAELSRVALAYEPVWAIGAERPADPAYVNDVVAGIRVALADEHGAPAFVIYGGTAGPGLLAELPDVDGLFLGRRAHDPRAFAEVLDEATASLRPRTGASR
ncbi:triose-phosphate isomerase family protein [Herbiconiux sp. SYSU D00978]|uniref:triose-phosphate isomerase family protein n=1 Tax=Herbiconiux sp. SYSU D00978 TaxID=2812562 RepID=UPI001A979AA2|nr:triose-phosphate isomerase family protein [Herbiconiux sp. SYSU D00978]